MNGSSYPQALCSRRNWLFDRRTILQQTSCGFGWLAFSGLWGAPSRLSAGDSPSTGRDESERPLAAKPPHFPARVKRVIFLCMRGGPSHLDTFDHKPLLQRDHGRPGPRPGSKLLGSPWKFQPSGKSGLPISDLFPALRQRADDLCLIRKRTVKCI